MNLLSLFSGAGGFDLAFEREGFNCTAHSEIDNDACTILHKHLPGSKCLGDIKEINTDEIKNIDIITGGFPCQDLSIAGARSGLAGARSGLFFDMAKIIAAITPSWIVLENVPGLLSSNKGADMATVIATLSEVGYCVAWRVLDSQYFGVAQRRRRVFIVGSFRNEGAAEILFERDGLQRNFKKKRKAGSDIARALTTSVERCDPTSETMIVAPLKCDPMRRNGGSAPIADEFIVDDLGVRRLVPKECERLQGFPYDWTEGLSDNARYRLLGNAVTVNVVQWIARRMKNMI